MKSALVLGAGFAGCTAADLLRRKGFAVTVLEGGEDPGGGVWTRFCAGHPYTFGPRVFFSRDDEVIRQLTSLVEMRQFHTRSWTFVDRDSRLYRYPIQRDDLPTMPDYPAIEVELREREGKTPSIADFEKYWTDAIGPTLYGKFISQYSKKMWGIESNKQLIANFEWVNRGTPIRNGDDRLYTDQFQGYPPHLDGYNRYFTRALEGCELHLNTRIQRFDSDRRVVTTTRGEFTGDVIVNTVHVDSLFGMEYGRLQFCGRQFLPIWLPVERVFPEDVTWIHYSGAEEFTRVTEFKQITGYASSSTLIGVEVPAPRGRYYPVQSPTELKRFEQYRTLFPADFYSIGRLGTFQYKGIPDAIRDALDVAAQVTQ